MIFHFTIPGEPIAQPRERVRVVGKFARHYTPAKHPVRNFKSMIQFAAHEAGLTQTPDGPVAVSILAVFARPKAMIWKRKPMPPCPHTTKPDADNVAKAVLDAMPFDDKLVARLVVDKQYAEGTAFGFTSVTVETLV